MVSEELLRRVEDEVRCHCAAKGHVSGPNWNPLTPRDSVAALAMAKYLVGSGRFDHYVAVAPEGHVYGFFFESVGAPVLSIFVDYPPRRAELVEDLSAVRGGRVLLLEDDVVSGLSLRLVLDELAKHAPGLVSLYLGRAKEDQLLENVPPSVAEVFLAEDRLDPARRSRFEEDFAEHFGRPGPLPRT
jgi:hypothetical protein